jgi:hypothetical protein
LNKHLSKILLKKLKKLFQNDLLSLLCWEYLSNIVIIITT